jgi:phosphate transport system protein
MAMRIQSRGTLDRELHALRDDLLRVAGMVEQSITQSIQALKERDRALAQSIMAQDAAINELRFQIEEHCLTIIATQQPAAGDLREIIAVMTIVSDLERMADHAAGVGKIVLAMGDEPLLKPLIDLPRMAEIVRGMLRGSLDAFLARDPQLAREVAARDDEVDLLYQQIFRELLSFMIENPRNTQRATYLLWIAHDLERIGDRVTNISERVIFLATGQLTELD